MVQEETMNYDECHYEYLPESASSFRLVELRSSISISCTPSVEKLSEEPPGDDERGETLSVVVAREHNLTIIKCTQNSKATVFSKER